jgi:hypothetical protein
MRAITRRGLRACRTSGPRPSFSSCPAEILHQHVGALGQLQRHRALALEVELHAQLVAPMHAEPHRVPVLRGAPAAERIAAGRLHLDHLGAEIGEQPRAERRREVVAEFHDLQSHQRPDARRRRGFGHAHRRLLLVPEAIGGR